MRDHPGCRRDDARMTGMAGGPGVAPGRHEERFGMQRGMRTAHAARRAGRGGRRSGARRPVSVPPAAPGASTTSAILPNLGRGPGRAAVALYRVVDNAVNHGRPVTGARGARQRSAGPRHVVIAPRPRAVDASMRRREPVRAIVGISRTYVPHRHHRRRGGPRPAVISVRTMAGTADAGAPTTSAIARLGHVAHRSDPANANCGSIETP